MRELTPDPFPFEYYVDYLNTPEVMSAIGAYVGFQESNDAVFDAFTATGDDNREDGTVGELSVICGIYSVKPILAFISRSCKLTYMYSCFTKTVKARSFGDVIRR